MPKTPPAAGVPHTIEGPIALGESPGEWLTARAGIAYDRAMGAARDTTIAAGLARGVCRALQHAGYPSLTEFRLTANRRVDVIGVDPAGLILIVEIKSSVADFRADRKWPEYRAYCDRFFFAVPAAFPREVLPDDCGLLVADPYGAAVLREAPTLKLNAARRRAQILRFAHTAAQRLARFTDPYPTALPDQSPDSRLALGQGMNFGTRLP